MNTETLERGRVAKKASKGDQPKPVESFDRVEFQAPPSWVTKVDRAAAALGMSRSAYIRMAVNRQMAADKKAE